MHVDELYGLAPERFVPERNALVRELRRAGRRDEAAKVAALRKPSVAAHVVNQLAREHTTELDRLFEAGDVLTEVQSEVLGGQADGRTLGEAAERERAAVSALVDAARELLAAQGLQASATVLERVSDTLHAAALDDEARRPVQQGRLERELRHVGLGMGAGGQIRQATRKPGTPATKPAGGKRADQAAARRQAEARKRAEAAEADTRRRAERAAKALEGAERERSRAAQALERAEADVAEARDEAEAANQAQRRAQRELDGL